MHFLTQLLGLKCTFCGRYVTFRVDVQVLRLKYSFYSGYVTFLGEHARFRVEV